jgi:iron complex outermembrane receptor protein
MGNYGESTTISHAPGINDTALNRAIGAGRFDPYDWRNSDPVILSALFNYETYGEARQRLVNFRAVADGTLFDLPGGAVKLAFGGEYTQEGYRVMNGAGIPGQILSGTPAVTVDGTLLYNAINPAQRFNLSRSVKAVFGELSVPIFGADNATTLFQSLTLSLSGRYDHYSGDVGGTFNPKIGVNWTPFEGVRLRGAWGKAFNAPSLADQRDASLTTVGTIGQFSTAPAIIAFYKPPADLIANNTIPNYDPKQTILTISGNAPGIRPQTGTTLSIGGDIDPPFIPGLRLGLTYWRIRLKDQIGQPPFFDAPTFWRYFRGNGVYIVPAAPNADSTDPEILKALALNQSGTPPTLCNQPAPLTNGNCVYAVFDQRKRNLGNTNVSGLDFSVSYRTETGFGGVDASWKGSLELQREEGAGPGAPLIDKTVSNVNLFRFSTVVGADIGNLRAQVTWNFRKGYDITPAAAIPGGGTQLKVGSFNVFNLFFKYDVKGEDMFKDLSFTLNVDNVFNQDPPVFYGSSASLAQSGFANGNTLGRIFTIGVNKRF